MQLVVSGNRILAHGENFLAMGGTVINTETGKTYQNATVVECDGCPSDIGEVGYEYHAGQFVPCAPYGKADDGAIMVACDECATPRRSGIRIKDLLSEETKALFGMDVSAVPDDIFGSIKASIDANAAEIGGRAQILAGSVSTTNSAVVVTLPFNPKCAFLQTTYRPAYQGVWVTGGNFVVIKGSSNATGSFSVGNNNDGTYTVTFSETEYIKANYAVKYLFVG